MDNSPALPKILSEEQVAEYLSHLGVTRRVVREHRKRGTLKPVQFSKRKVGFTEEAVADWMALLYDQCPESRKTSCSNTVDGGLSPAPIVPSTMEQDTTGTAEESAAKALARTILTKQKIN